MRALRPHVIKVRLVPAVGTDVLCVVCGDFRAELSLLDRLGNYGVHTKCEPMLRARRDSKEG